MRIRTSWTATFHLNPSLGTVKAIRAVGLRHYDGTCKSVSVGGFLINWEGCAANGFEITATFREIDLTLKICEMARMFYSHMEGGEEKLALVEAYCGTARSALLAANRDYHKHNESSGVLSPIEARARFGNLTTGGAASSHMEITDHEGTWVPQFDGSLNLTAYKLQE